MTLRVQYLNPLQQITVITTLYFVLCEPIDSALSNGLNFIKRAGTGPWITTSNLVAKNPVSF